MSISTTDSLEELRLVPFSILLGSNSYVSAQRKTKFNGSACSAAKISCRILKELQAEAQHWILHDPNLAV